MPDEFSEEDMSFDTMNFKLFDPVHRCARKHVFEGTPLHDAWADIVKTATPAIGAQVAKIALKLPVTQGLVSVTAEYASLLQRDNAGPAKKVNGLWFGLVEFSENKTIKHPHWLPYISGSERFKPKNREWAVAPEWCTDDCFAPNEPMDTLSRLRAEHKLRSWYIDVCLIEPLHRLYTAHFARSCPSHILLGTQKSRGIGCGIDSGDLLTIGTVDAKGFNPLKTP